MKLTRLVLQEIWANDFVVHDDTAVVLQLKMFKENDFDSGKNNTKTHLNGSHAPDEKYALDEPIEGNNFGDVEREEFNSRECCKNHPVDVKKYKRKKKNIKINLVSCEAIKNCKLY